jgi:hypothetical protein
MFNWSASRWRDQRGDVKGVNKPIKVEKDTIIKMITIGPGKLDSEVVTFKFTADMSGKAVDPTKVPGGPPIGVTLDKKRIDLPVGSTYRLEATVTPFNATNKDLTWSSSNTRVATVDNNGLVTVIGPGTAVITVTTVDGKYIAKCVVNGPDEEVISVTNSSEQDPQETELEHLPEPEPQMEMDSASDTNASEIEPDPLEASIPEGRGQYLAKKDDLAADFNADLALQQLGSENLQVYEMSADTIPLPLKEAQDRMRVYTTIMLIMFLLSGAGNKYGQYIKERL